MGLTARQRAYLRSLGQHEEPVVFIGKAGETSTLRVQLEDALQARELVKCRVLPSAPADPEALAGSLAADSQADLVGVTGRTFLLYRPSKKKSRIELP